MMKRYKHIRAAIVVVLAVVGISMAAVSSIETVSAVDNKDSDKKLECGILPQSLCNKAKQTDSNIEGSATWGLLRLAVQILTGGVGIVAIGGIMYGATLYMSAGGSQEQLKKAKSTLLNVVIGIVAFALMFGVLQWLIPGGVF